MKSYSRKQFGNFGESVAAYLLSIKGHEVLEQNYRFDRAEVDIISMTDEIIVFTEVKTRKNNSHGFPELYITNAQKERITKVADHYIREKNVNSNIRFDVMVLTPSGPQIHIEDAFWIWE